MMQRRNKRLVGAQIPFSEDLPAALQAARLELCALITSNAAERKGRVVVIPSVSVVQREGWLYVRAQTAPRPNWKRVRP